MSARISTIKKVAILTGASLAWNPRAFKEAKTLADAGFDVVVYGSNQNESKARIDSELATKSGFRFVPVNVRRETQVLRLFPDLSRLHNRIGRILFKVFAIENPWQIGPLTTELRHQALISKSDYHIVHLEQALWVGANLLKHDLAVGIDMEDWYSEDLMPEARAGRPLRSLRDLEATLLRSARHSTCPSLAMRNALAGEFNCPPPQVIYNAFPWSDRRTLDGQVKDRMNRLVPSIHWYSQTLGHGRGLEELFTALPFIDHDIEIHLRGNPIPGFEAWLDQQVAPGRRSRVFLHDLVSNDELLSRIAEHDIGFAGEQKYCRSRDLTVTNKILHYLLGGLAVVASDTAGQHEIAQQAGAGVRLYHTGDPLDLAAQFNSLLENRQRLNEAKAAALSAAKQTFCWERQQGKLLDSVERALHDR